MRHDVIDRLQCIDNICSSAMISFSSGKVEPLKEEEEEEEKEKEKVRYL